MFAAPTVARKTLLRFITCGSVDDGKSTLIGRLLYDAGLVPDDQLETLQADSLKQGLGSALDMSLLVDGLQAEREQGITIDVAYRYFSTPTRSFIVADTPGHEQYTRNMATGASTADLAILLVDARKGLLTQTRRHSLIVSMLGVRQVILAVNKMDLVGYSSDVFDAIETEYRSFAATLGFDRIDCVPVSARDGDNIVNPTGTMAWYDGLPLIEQLERAEIEPGRQRQPFRMPVQWVNRPDADFRGFAGFVAGGSIRPGDEVSVLPAGTRSRVAAIVVQDGSLDQAVAGQSITLTLEDEIDISRGDVIVGAGTPPLVADALRARILWLSTDAMASGRVYALKIGARTAMATLRAPDSVIDINTGVARAQASLALNEIGTLDVMLDRAMVFDAYRDSRDMGGFILMDRISNDTVAMGLAEAAVARPDRLVAGDPDEAASLASLEGIATPSGGFSALGPVPRKKPWRSVAHAISWRITGSLATFLLALVITGSVAVAATIAGAELLTKIVLRALHERLWNRLRIGYQDGRPDD